MTRIAHAGWIIAALILPSALSAGAPAPAYPHTVAGLTSFEDSLFKAEVDRDLAVVQRDFAPDVRFVHANGVVQTKSDYLAAMRQGTFPVTGVKGENRDVHVLGDAGFTRGTKKVIVGGMVLAGTYLAVYGWNGGRWHLLSSQSAPEAKPATSTADHH